MPPDAQVLTTPRQALRRQLTGGLMLAVFTALLMTPNVMAWFFLDSYSDNQYAWQELAYAMALWIGWLALIGDIWWACMLSLPLMLFIPPEGYLMVRYRAPLDPHVLGVLRETDFVEASEYMRGLWGLALAAVGATAVVAYFCLRGIRRVRLRWRHRSRYWVLLSLLALGGGFHLLYERQEEQYDLQARPDAFRVAPPPFLIDRLQETSPFGIPLRAYAYFEAERKIARAEAVLKDFRFGAYQEASAPAPETFVFVLGESSRADRWAINGYSRPTSPELGAQRNLVSFQDMVSVYSATRRSIPIILTRKPSQMDFGLVFPERSFVSAFKEAGFRTYWFSMQSPTGYHDSPVALYARESDVLRFLNFASYLYATPFDDILLPKLENALQESHSRQLIVLHTMGSHFNYALRYPSEFDVFRPSKGDNGNDSLHKPASSKFLNNSYDNSILYTDHFLAEVIRRLRDSGRPVTAMLFVADHGEQLFDAGCRAAGHSFSTRQNFHIASFFWYSDGYAKAYPGKIAKLRENKNRKLTTETIFATMLDAADIRFPNEDRSRSLLSEEFRERQRIVHGMLHTVDYDRAHADADCQLVN